MSVTNERCDLVEKSYLCGINNNFARRVTHLASVVICLKSLTFVVSITTVRKSHSGERQL